MISDQLSATKVLVALNFRGSQGSVRADWVNVYLVRLGNGERRDGRSGGRAVWRGLVALDANLLVNAANFELILLTFL